MNNLFSQKNEQMNVGIYCRLSRDDGNLGESGSIQNQKEFLTEYVKKLGWNLVGVYDDDGFSGTNFDRPGFKSLIADIERKRVNCVVTKDLSRLGRNYVKSGYYLDEYFPKNNIRYIAVNDNYDSLVEGTTDFGALKNVVNEWYAKDISKKVKFTLHAKQQRGEAKKVSFPLYGYIQDDEGNRLPDPETASIVNLIYDKYIEFKSLTKVANHLKENKIYCPGYQQFLRTGYNSKGYLNCAEEKKYNWRAEYLRTLIVNREYLGDYVTSKKQTLSFKLKVVRKNDNPYVFEGKYEPLVSKEVFEKANRILRSYRASYAPQSENLFQKIVRCECCGKPLGFGHKTFKKNDEGLYRYYCRNEGCHDHAYITKHILVETIKKELKSMMEYILEHKDEFYQFVLNLTKNNKPLVPNIDEGLIKRKKEVEKFIEGAFKGFNEGDLPESIYRSLLTQYKAELEQIEKKLSATKTEVSFVNYELEAEYLLEQLQELVEFEELTTDLIGTLCDKILVSNVKENGRIVKYKITIYYGVLDAAIKEFIANGR